MLPAGLYDLAFGVIIARRFVKSTLARTILFLVAKKSVLDDELVLLDAGADGNERLML